MSLADELLADLDEDEGIIEANEQENLEGQLEEVGEQFPNMNIYDRVDAVAKLASTQKFIF